MDTSKLISIIVICPSSQHVFPYTCENTYSALQRFVRGGLALYRRLPKNDMVFVNANEANTPPPHYWWWMPDHPRILNGTAVIARLNYTGALRTPNTSVSEVEEYVEFLTPLSAHLKREAYRAAPRPQAAVSAPI